MRKILGIAGLMGALSLCGCDDATKDKNLGTCTNGPLTVRVVKDVLYGDFDELLLTFYVNNKYVGEIRDTAIGALSFACDDNRELVVGHREVYFRKESP